MRGNVSTPSGDEIRKLSTPESRKHSPSFPHSPPFAALRHPNLEETMIHWTDFALEKLRLHPLREHLHDRLEWHFSPTRDDDLVYRWGDAAHPPHPHRIAQDDSPMDYHPELIDAVGTSHWNWRSGQTEAAYYDFDYGHGRHGLDDTGISRIDALAEQLPYVTNLTSKSGRGRHWVVRLSPLPAKTRADHARNCLAVRAHLSQVLGVDLSAMTCASPGGIEYLWARNMPPEGMQLIKAATETLEIDPPEPEPEPESEPESEPEAHTATATWDATHRSIFAAVQAAGFPVSFDQIGGKAIVRLHTCGLAHDYATNRRLGPYSTNSPGTDTTPNAYAFPLPNGGLAVRKYGQATDTDDWHTGPSGVACIDYNLPPEIRVGTDLDGMTTRSIEALGAEPNTYQRGGLLVEVAHDAPKPKLCLTDNGAPRFRAITTPALTRKLSTCARFVRRKKDDFVPCLPPENVVNAILASVDHGRVPVATGIVSHLVLRADGSIATQRGYDPLTGLYLDISGDFPPLMDPRAARELLLDILVDFPFASDAHRSGWIAALLTLLARAAIAGSTPFFLVDANVSRTGKGLLLDALTTTVEGLRAARYALPKCNDELRKLITSVALSGSPYLCLDNLQGRIGGATLENALTASRWSDRILGANRQVDLPLTFAWLGTANNAQLSTDMIGRTCHIRLESPLETPGTRTGFRYPDLLAHVKAHRRELAIAALSIPAGFIRAGRPSQGLPAWGGFEEWSNLIRDSIVWAGLPDCDTRAGLAAVADDDTEQLRALMQGWAELGGPATVAEAVKRVEASTVDAYPMLREVLDDMSGSKHKLGLLLRGYRGRVLDGRKFERSNEKIPKWSLVTVTNV